MTKEQCIGLLKRYAEYDGMGIPNLAGCKEAMRMAAELLERHSLPSNLDEAAIDFADNARKQLYTKDYAIASIADYDHGCIDGFKAGAEWMAAQFQRIEGELVDWYKTKGVDYCYGISTNESFEVPEGFYIRKK